MTESEIRQNILYNEELIQDYQRQRTVVEGEIEELEALKVRLGNFQIEFATRQESRRSGLKKYWGFASKNNIFSRYMGGMQELLNGQEYQNTYDGLTTAKEKVQRKMDEKNSAYSEIERNLIYRRQRKSYWEQQLRNYYSAKENENGS